MHTAVKSHSALALDEPSRRKFLHTSLAIALGLALRGSGRGGASAAEPTGTAAPRRKPVIDCTDLYHPHQDVGDNFDLIAAYALPEVDLKAVIIDVTERYRTADGVRDAGFVAVHQLNSVFNRSVPCAVTPYAMMRSPEDPMLDAPRFQQSGIELLLATLAESNEPVEITAFGSARAIAVAFNRQPDVIRQHVGRIHLCIGASEPGFVEWNVALDPQAFVRLLRSDLPIAVHPCATREGPFAYGPHNCFWQLNDLRFVERMDPRLQAYLAFAFTRSNRMDFLRAVEESPTTDALRSFTGRKHNVWETGTWLQVSGRRLVRRADGTHRILAAAEVLRTDTVLPNELRPCRIAARETGEFEFALTDQPSNFWIYDRGDPKKNELALREALPEMYAGFATR